MADHEPTAMDEMYAMPGHLIRRAHQISTALFTEECGQFDMTSVQYAALTAVRTYPDVDATRLSALIAFDRSTIGDVLERLEAKGWLSRGPSPTDRRVKRLRITPDGVCVAGCRGGCGAAGAGPAAGAAGTGGPPYHDPAAEGNGGAARRGLGGRLRADQRPGGGGEGDDLAGFVRGFGAHEADGFALAQDRGPAGDGAGADCGEELHFEFQRGAGSGDLAQQVAHGDIQRRGQHPAMQGALRVVHEVLDGEGDVAGVFWIGDL